MLDQTSPSSRPPSRLGRPFDAAQGAMATQKGLPPFILRSAVPADTEALGEMLLDAYTRGLAHDYAPNVIAAALPVISAPKERLIRSGTYFVADAGGGRLLAAGGWSWSGPVGGVAPKDTAHIRHLVVGAGFGGQGVGRLMLSHIRASAARAGVRRLSCTCTLSAAGFYEAQGFVRRCDVALTLGPGLSFPAVQLEGLAAEP